MGNAASAEKLREACKKNEFSTVKKILKKYPDCKDIGNEVSIIFADLLILVLYGYTIHVQ